MKMDHEVFEPPCSLNGQCSMFCDKFPCDEFPEEERPIENS